MKNTTDLIEAIKVCARDLVSGLIDLTKPHPPPDYTKALEKLESLTDAFPELAEAERLEREATPDPEALLQRHRDANVRMVTATRNLDSARERYRYAKDCRGSQSAYWDEPESKGPSVWDLEKDAKRAKDTQEEAMAECESLTDPITVPTRKVAVVMKMFTDIEWSRKEYDSTIECLPRIYDPDGTCRPQAALEAKVRFDKGVTEGVPALEKALEELKHKK